MAPPGTIKPTLELRHQLSCSGISIEAAAYDGRRHHLLTYDSHELKPHTLRLFSLRREIRSTPLFDDVHRPPAPTAPDATQPRSTMALAAATALLYVSLVYAHDIDVFVCVVSAVHIGEDKRKAKALPSAGYSVVVLEPGSLKKLVVYTGPQAHHVRCSCFDEASGRLVLASQVADPLTQKPDSRRKPVRVATPTTQAAHSNVIEVLEITKRQFRRPQSALSSAVETTREEREEKVMLCVERLTRATVWHGDLLDCIAAAPKLRALYGAGICVYEDEVKTADSTDDSVILEWIENADGGLEAGRRIIHERDVISCLKVSPTGNWVFSGHLSGLLKMWWMGGSTRAPTLDKPRTFASDDDGASRHQSPVALIELRSGSTASHGDHGEVIILFTTERLGSKVQHWRFCAPLMQVSAATPPPSLDCLGLLDAGGTSDASELVKGRKTKIKQTLTIPLSISLHVGGYSENLLVVTRGDTISAVKVQSLLQVVQESQFGDTFYSLRHLRYDDQSHAVLTLSGSSTFSRVSVSLIDPVVSEISSPRETILSAPKLVTAKDTPRLTVIEVFSTISFGGCVVCGWSSGAVELYAIEDAMIHRRLALLQDPRLNVDVTACVLAADPTASRTSNTLDRIWHLLLAGSASGTIYVWRVQLHLPASCQFLLEAAFQLDAHSGHIVNLCVSAVDSVMSVGGDGVVKFWSLPHMRLTCHVMISSGRPSCSCGELINDASALVLGCDDGSIAAWERCVLADARDTLSFTQLAVGGKHDRRVTNIVDVGRRKFASSSFDMTIVLWAVERDGQVEEVRFFELGSPVIDCCCIANTVLVAFKDEVCWFALDDTETFRQHTLPVVKDAVTSRTGRLAESGSQDVTDETQQPQRLSEIPEQRSPRDASTPLLVSPQEEALTSIPSVVVPGTLSANESFDDVSRSTLDVATSGALEGWNTDHSSESLLDPEVITAYMAHFIATAGTASTIAAESLSQFLIVQHFPLSRRTRPDFLARKYLRDNKIDPKAKLTLEEASLAIQGMLELTRSLNSARKAAQSGNTRSRTASNNKPANRSSKQKTRDDRVAVVTFNILGEKSVKWITRSAISNQVDITEPTETPYITTNQPNSKRYYRKNDGHALSMKGLMAAPKPELPDSELLARLRLSPAFQTMWTKGYCWCPASRVVVSWEGNANPSNVKATCGQCGLRRHDLHLDAHAYQPHFPARMILRVIVEAYETLVEPANRALFKHGEVGADEEHLISAHMTLWRLFQQKFGVQHIIEKKIKLFLLSICHYVHTIDAIAVFGELLSCFQRPEDDEVPTKLVALCAVAQNWFYAREMVVMGEPILAGSKVNSGDTIASSKGSHWHFVPLSNALCCAQELLVYPLVSPGYLQNILMFMQDYSQASATRPMLESTDHPDETRWIEVHRFLRFLVGEWRQHTSDFRAVDGLLFTKPLESTVQNVDQHQALSTVLEKLRLILSCFVFYDHERLGVTEISDFEAILRRLKYLWPNEHLTEEQAAGATRYQDSLTFENTIIAARRRFGDAQGDGQICYLDFWAMLYIVGVGTKTLLKFREIPSFCKDYKLEVSPDLHDMLSIYMQRSSALLLPRGFHMTKSSTDEQVQHQHKRRVGGLYDGVFSVDQTTMRRTLSMQELLGSGIEDSVRGLYVDGSVPGIRHSASTTAMDAYHPVSVSNDRPGRVAHKEPVVMGHRPLGPAPKSVAFLRVTEIASIEGAACTDKLDSPVEKRSVEGVPSVMTSLPAYPAQTSESFMNIYIQFPDITPRRSQIDIPEGSFRSVSGSLNTHDDEETAKWRKQLLQAHQQEEHERHAVHESHMRRVTLQREQAMAASAIAAAATSAASPTSTHRRSQVSPLPPRERVSPSKPTASAEEQPPSIPTDSNRTSAQVLIPRTDEAVVVIPKVEKHELGAPAPSSSLIGRHTLTERRRAFRDESAKGEQKEDAGPEQSSTQWGDQPSAAVVIVSAESDSSVSHEASAIKNANTVENATSVVARELEAQKEEESDAVVDDATRQEGEDGMVDGEVSDDGDGVSDTDNDDDDNAEDRDADDDSPRTDIGSEYSENGSETVDMTTTMMPPVADNVKGDPVSLHQPECSPQLILHNMNEEHHATPPQPAVQAKKPEDERPILEKTDANVDVSVKAQPGNAVETVVVATTPSTSTASYVPEPTPPPLSSSPPKATVVVPRETSPPPTTQVIAASPPRKLTSSQLRHRFKFSQQPKFNMSAAINSNPFRSRSWNPLDNSESGGSGSEASDGDAYDDNVAVEDMRLHLSRESVVALNKQFEVLHRKSSCTRAVGTAAIAFGGGLRMRLASSFGSTSIDPRGNGQRQASSPVKLDEDAERALYGERVANYLGEGVVFSAEEEERMQRKWNEFFSHAEATMFSPLKQAIEAREEAQRREEELQSRLMKKRIEQQNQDTMRLQRNSTVVTTVPGETKQMSRRRQDATFRVRRMTREACFQVQHELKYGESTEGEIVDSGHAEYFHFLYDPSERNGPGILTVRLHVLEGDVEMFMSTKTKAPCASDFMWRCVGKSVMIEGHSADDEGQKIILFPHDLVRAVADATGQSAGTSTTPEAIVFYVAVVALEPNSIYSLGVMRSGQKGEVSKAIQTVDSLIASFNQLAKLYEGQTSRRISFLEAEGNRPARGTTSSASTTVDRLRAFLAATASSSVNYDEGCEGVEAVTRRGCSRSSVANLLRRTSCNRAMEEATAAIDETVNARPSRRRNLVAGDESLTGASVGSTTSNDEINDGVDVVETSSFQQLLESIGDKHSFMAPASHSFVLSGATQEQQEFLRDEEVSLEQIQSRLSQESGKRSQATIISTPSVGGFEFEDAKNDAIALVSDRRRWSPRTQSLQRLRVEAKVRQRLSPLKAGAKRSANSSVGLNVARFEPKRVAYSLSSLPPQRTQLSTLPPGPRAKLPL